MTLYSDAYLEHYADRFIALRLARRGVTLLQYLANIEQCERLALEPEPLLPAQQAAVLRLWQRWDTGLGAPASPAVAGADWQDWRELLARWQGEAEQLEGEVAHLPRRNGAYVEPLHHQRYIDAFNRVATELDNEQE